MGGHIRDHRDWYFRDPRPFVACSVVLKRRLQGLSTWPGNSSNSDVLHTLPSDAREGVNHDGDQRDRQPTPLAHYPLGSNATGNED
jgi:hypothetical protein